MMPDIDRFVELYRSVGVCLMPLRPADEATKLRRYWGEMERMGAAQMLILSAEEDLPIIGWKGYFSYLYFDEHGKFVGQGIWE